VPSFNSIVIRLRLSAAETDRLIELQRFSASAYLDRWFASDALKAALSFDAGVDGVSPHEAGSALALVWRLAQESYGVQAAVSQPKGGSASLVIALANANKHFGVELRTGRRVASIIVENGRAAGVVLESGEAYGAGAVISNLDFSASELLPPAAVASALLQACPTPQSGQRNSFLA
jgi:phytoene dehydrogenase-like protein